MLGYALGIVVLLLRPNWVLLFAFSAAFAVFGFMGGMREFGEPMLAGIAALINAGVFFLLGGAVVIIRLWLRSRTTKADKDVDAELARIRAEAAARESNPNG